MLDSVRKIIELNKYTDEKKTTEEYALSSEQAFSEYYEDVTDTFKELFADADKCVRNRDVRNYIEIINRSFCEYQFLNEYLELKAIADVCCSEMEAEEKNTFISEFANLDEALQSFRELKHLFYRIQFSGCNSDAQFNFFQFRLNNMECGKKDVCNYVLSNSISRTALNYLIENIALDKFGMAYFFAQAFMDESKLSYALYFYRKCNSLNEGREDILVPMANIYHICDRDSIAIKCLDAIKEPSYGVRELYIKYGHKVGSNE